MNKYLRIVLILSLYSSSTLASNTKNYDVAGIGKAMVDLITFTNDAEMNQMLLNIKKGDSNKVNELKSDEIYNKLSNLKIIPGGSEANVIVNIASLGGKTSFNAISANDELGNAFKQSLLKEGVDFSSPFTINKNLRTARCFTFITPDKDRTFIVSENITNFIDDSYINYDNIAKAKIFYTDASNLDHGKNKSKITFKAVEIAKSNNTEVAFNLNNNRYVETFRAEILKLLPKVDIFVGSEKEALILFKTKDLNEAIKQYKKHSKIVIITRSSKGALIASKDETIEIPTLVSQNKAIDFNGAGDAFIAGFLYGYSHGYTLKNAGFLGARTAAQIIYQVGARPTTSLKKSLL